MTPASVQFSRGARKYEMPLLRTSLSILCSIVWYIAIENSFGAIFSSILGRVALCMSERVATSKAPPRPHPPEDGIFDAFTVGIK